MNSPRLSWSSSVWESNALAWRLACLFLYTNRGSTLKFSFLNWCQRFECSTAIVRRRIWRMRVQVSTPLQGLSFLRCPGNKRRLLVIFSVGRGKSLVSPLRRCPLGTFSVHRALNASSWRHHGSFAKLGAMWGGEQENGLLQGAHRALQEQIGLMLMSYFQTHWPLQSLRRLAHWATCVAGMTPFNLHRWSWRRNFISSWQNVNAQTNEKAAQVG